MGNKHSSSLVDVRQISGVEPNRTQSLDDITAPAKYNKKKISSNPRHVAPVEQRRQPIFIKPNPQRQIDFTGPKRNFGGKTTTMRRTSSVPGLNDVGKDDAILEYVANSVVGKDTVFSGPFGQRQVLYLDYIASGKPLTFIEEYMSKEVLPRYANTHTTTSTTARQTTALREDARKIIARTTNCTEDDVVIFTGNGVTGAIHKLIHALDFTEPPVVIIGPYEHHSNILPWREIRADVTRIGLTPDGVIDLTHLEEELKKWSVAGRRIVGSMTAASNVTGILCDVVAVTVLLHKYGALSFWDYATAAPYVELDMNPASPTGKDQSLAHKDAIFVSPHKFVGGVSTPGLLIAKKKLFMNPTPHNCGGGTVLVVRKTGHRYLENIEEREEGGTPAIVGAIRAGLVFQLKAAITPRLIMEKEHYLFRRAREAWSMVPQLNILGSLDVERLPVFSFLIQHDTGYYLHHNFVACLFNDLFGIQARGGCACAGPYAMDLLGISEQQAQEIEDLLVAEQPNTKKRAPSVFGGSKREIFKPGFTRLNLPYFIKEDQLEFVLKAVSMVAEHGWKLLPQYTFNPSNGEWRHENSGESKEQRRLDQLSYSHGFLEVRTPKMQNGQQPPENYDSCLEEAKQIIAAAEQNPPSIPDQSHLFENFTRTSRWFLLPSEASAVLRALSEIRHFKPAHQFISPKDSPRLVNGPNTSGSSSGSRSPHSTLTSLCGSEGDIFLKTGNRNGKVKGGKPIKIKVKAIAN